MEYTLFEQSPFDEISVNFTNCQYSPTSATKCQRCGKLLYDVGVKFKKGYCVYGYGDLQLCMNNGCISNQIETNFHTKIINHMIDVLRHPKRNPCWPLYPITVPSLVDVELALNKQYDMYYNSIDMVHSTVVPSDIINLICSMIVDPPTEETYSLMLYDYYDIQIWEATIGNSLNHHLTPWNLKGVNINDALSYFKLHNGSKDVDNELDRYETLSNRAYGADWD